MIAAQEGVVNVERRKWDRDEFAKRAQERALREVRRAAASLVQALHRAGGALTGANAAVARVAE